MDKRVTVLGAIAGGLLLLNKKKPSSIGVVYDTNVSDTIPCKNGRYSDSLKTGGCSANGGIDKEKVFQENLKAKVSYSAKEVNVEGKVLTASFKSLIHHNVKNLYSSFSRSYIKRLSVDTDTNLHNGKSTIRVEYKSTKAMNQHLLEIVRSGVLKEGN